MLLPLPPYYSLLECRAKAICAQMQPRNMQEILKNRNDFYDPTYDFILSIKFFLSLYLLGYDIPRKSLQSYFTDDD